MYCQSSLVSRHCADNMLKDIHLFFNLANVIYIVITTTSYCPYCIDNPLISMTSMGSQIVAKYSTCVCCIN